MNPFNLIEDIKKNFDRLSFNITTGSSIIKDDFDLVYNKVQRDLIPQVESLTDKLSAKNLENFQRNLDQVQASLAKVQARTEYIKLSSDQLGQAPSNLDQRG